MAGLAIYLDPEDSIDVIKDYIDKNSTTIGVNALFDDNHDRVPVVEHKNEVVDHRNVAKSTIMNMIKTTQAGA